MKPILPVKPLLVLQLSITILSACVGLPPASGLGNPAPEASPTQVQPSPAMRPSAVHSAIDPLIVTAQPTSPSKLPAKVSGCSQASLQESVILVSWSPLSDEQELVLTDLQTGQPLCEFEPIQAGKQYSPTLSPDGKTLAMTISNRDDGEAARLHLLDLESWQLSETPVELEGWVSQLKFSPDGRRLVVASLSPTNGKQGIQNSMHLYLIDLSSQSVVAEILLDINPRLLEYLPDGSALILYGYTLGPNNLTQGDPTAVMLEPSKLQEIWQVSLPGILEGQYQDEGIEGPEGLRYWSTGLAFLPKSQTLFIVHADSDRLTKVDFASHTLNTVKIRRATSWLERLLTLTAGVAHAKILNGTTKTAVLFTRRRAPVHCRPDWR